MASAGAPDGRPRSVSGRTATGADRSATGATGRSGASATETSELVTAACSGRAAEATSDDAMDGAGGTSFPGLALARVATFGPVFGPFPRFAAIRYPVSMSTAKRRGTTTVIWMWFTDA
ncbi:hypothetical protein GCM10011504_34950 [Siccirubricoccus deserti]|nr:hypothetical protein GCM10011504_34950 [Siccirubricoccus deserti]